VRVRRPQPLSSTPTVTVVVPCYNYGRFLPDAVGSALDQPGVDVDVIVVDDCSTDGSELVAKQLEAAHPQVRLIQNPTNLGHIATYDRGLSEATGDYVVLLSADDLLAPGALTRATALFQAFPNVGFVYGYAPSFTEAPEPAPVPRTWSTWTGDQWLQRMARRGDNLVTNPEVVMRRSLMDELGAYDPAFPHAADMLLWLQCAARHDVGRVNGVQAYYREHGANLHRTDFAGTVRDMRERLLLFRKFFGPGGDGHDRPGAPGLLVAAERSIAVEAMWNACRALDRGAEVGGAGATEFGSLACEAYPAIVRGRLYRAYRRRLAGPVPAWQARALDTAYDVRWKVRWRRWRRWGT
jgi:glycosyltransferase involved in cell wall biosynthesis